MGRSLSKSLNRRTCLQLTDRIRESVQRSANLSFLPLCSLSTQKAAWNMKLIEWKRANPARMFCLYLVPAPINSRAHYFETFQ